MDALSIKEVVEFIAKYGDSTAVEVCNIRNRSTKLHREVLCHALRYYGFDYAVISQVISGGSLQTLRNYTAKELGAEQKEALRLVKEKFGGDETINKIALVKLQEKLKAHLYGAEMKKEDLTPLIAEAQGASGISGIEEFCHFTGYKVKSVLLWREGIERPPIHFRKMLGFIIRYGIKPETVS